MDHELFSVQIVLKLIIQRDFKDFCAVNNRVLASSGLGKNIISVKELVEAKGLHVYNVPIWDREISDFLDPDLDVPGLVLSLLH